MVTREYIAEEFQDLQYAICAALEEADGKGRFSVEEWKREEGGGGITRVMQHGQVIEKGGVNFSAVHGELPQNILDALKVKEKKFFATGVSIVIHPHNPFVPIIHMNVRYFELGNGDYWFGGGIDLTPHYVDEEEAMAFHKAVKEACDEFDSTYYSRFSQQADDYFFIRHRNETRGVGGIFFDRLSAQGENEKAMLLDFVLRVGLTFAPVYTSIMKKKASLRFKERHKQWQLLRRGRYVEFNLVYDKGTKFGLDTNGRIESILMSLPENASWLYNFVPEPGSEEEKTLGMLKKGRFRA